MTRFTQPFTQHGPTTYDCEHSGADQRLDLVLPGVSIWECDVCGTVTEMKVIEVDGVRYQDGSQSVIPNP